MGTVNEFPDILYPVLSPLDCKSDHGKLFYFLVPVDFQESEVHKLSLKACFTSEFRLLNSS